MSALGDDDAAWAGRHPGDTIILPWPAPLGPRRRVGLGLPGRGSATTAGQ